MPANNECLSRNAVGIQVDNQLLQWKNGLAPTLGARMVTRAWFSTYVANVGGFPEDERLMTWGQMETYRLLGPLGVPTISSVQDVSTCENDVPVYKVTVYWSNGDPLAETYFDYRGGETSIWTYLGSANPGDTSKTFIMPDSPGSYFIRAWHMRNGVPSVHSAISVVWIEYPCVPVGPIGVPTISSVQDASTCDNGLAIYQVTVYWSNGDPLADTHFEYQKLGQSTWNYLGSANPGETLKTFSRTLDGPGSYIIRALHMRNGVPSAYSASSEVWIEDPCDVPVGPSGVPTISSVQDVSTCDNGRAIYQTTVYWSNGDPLADTHFEYQEGGTDIWTYLGSANPGDTSNTFIMPDSPGSYIIRAWHTRDGLPSAYSASSEVWIEDPCDVPVDPGGPGEP